MNTAQLILPLVLSFALDLIFGDPYNCPHPIRLIGKMISGFESFFRKKFPKKEKLSGFLLAISVLLISTAVPFFICSVCYRLNAWFGAAVEGILCYYLIAPRCLKCESMKVYNAVGNGDIEGARKAVSMIVGRDTATLDESGIIKAAVETVAENTSDGVTAPLIFMTLSGAPLGYFYKAANTMDSMIGYKNDKYKDFGFFAAKLDDVLNFIPSRLTALVMIAAAYILGFDGANAFRIWKRDRLNHSSPNSAQTESVCAGALGVRLGGDAYYFGKLVRKKSIGDDSRPVENEDIKRSNWLMYCTTVIMLLLSVLLRAFVWGAFL